MEKQLARRRLLTHLCLFTLLGVGVTLPGVGGLSRPAHAQPPGRAGLLVELRERLDMLAALDPREPVERGGDLDVSPLVGMTRAQIQQALGAPERCRMDGDRAVPAPCRTGTDWFYSFYRFPPGWRGGGPELLLQFDRSNVCTVARWTHTR